jgi:amidase
MGFLSVGSDIGGSIRVPASWTGTYGHKPTLNVVPLRGHIPPMPGAASPPPTLPVAGPMARSAADLLLALRALGGPEREDAVAYSWRLPPARRARLGEFRVGYALDHPACPVVPEVREVLEAAIEKLRRAGLRAELGWPDGVDPVGQFRTYEYLVSMVAFGPNLDESRLDAVRRLADTGKGFDAVVARAQTDHWKRIAAREEERIAARQAWQRWFQSHDLFLMPVVFTTAPRHLPPMTPIETAAGPRPYLDLLWWIAFATLSGCPATVAPAGRTAPGLPVGLQIMGPYLEDATPIAFAERMAEVVGGFERPPGV